MDVIRKDATITNTDDAFPGTFEVILSAPTKDRDGETLLPEEWKQPLPDHITFDQDHGMSVASTVGSGVPRIDEKGNLVVSGTYSSLPRAQEVRTLVKEGHINRTSVAFMSEKTQKDGTSTVTRELLNGAFVAIPANREAVILSSKGVKSGARNSKADQFHLDEIARHAIALGANIDTGDDPQGGDTGADADVAASKSFRATLGKKSVAGSFEQRQQAISDALSAAYPDADGESDRYVYAFPTATFPDTVVYRVSGKTDDVGQWQASYTLNDDGTVTLGPPSRVNLVEQIVPVTGAPDEDADSGAVQTAAAGVAKAAPAAAVGTAPVEDHSIDQQLMAARKRFYATLNEGN